MESEIRRSLHSLIFAVLYLLLFVILIPPLIKVLNEAWGKALYGGLILGAIGVALRLRWVSHKIQNTSSFQSKSTHKLRPKITKRSPSKS